MRVKINHLSNYKNHEKNERLKHLKQKKIHKPFGFVDLPVSLIIRPSKGCITTFAIQDMLLPDLLSEYFQLLHQE